MHIHSLQMELKDNLTTGEKMCELITSSFFFFNFCELTFNNFLKLTSWSEDGSLEAILKSSQTTF